jgi:hypothetical protein
VPSATITVPVGRTRAVGYDDGSGGQDVIYCALDGRQLGRHVNGLAEDFKGDMQVLWAVDC